MPLQQELVTLWDLESPTAVQHVVVLTVDGEHAEVDMPEGPYGVCKDEELHHHSIGEVVVDIVNGMVMHNYQYDY